MTRSRKSLLFVTVGACILGFWALVVNPSTSVVELRIEKLLEDREVPLGPALSGARRPPDARVPVEVENDSSTVSKASAKEKAPDAVSSARTASIKVYVYEDETGTAVAGAEVKFAQFPREARIDAVSGTTTADGGCIIVYDPNMWEEGEMYTASVVTFDDIQIFHGVVPFRHASTVLTAPVVALRGSIRLAPSVLGESEFDYSKLYVTIVVHTNDKRRPARHFAATAPSSDGSYEAHGVLRNRPVAATVIVQGEVANVHMNASLDAQLADLRSPDGAMHYLQLQMLDFLVLQNGESFPGANVVVRTASETARPSQVRLVTNAEGAASYLLEPGLIEYCISSPGYGTYLGTHEVREHSSAPISVELHSLGPEDVISGEVRTHDGEPVADALVVCVPISRNDSFLPESAYTKCITGDDGAFVVAAPEGQTATLTAFRKDLGLTPQSRIVASPDARVLIFFNTSAELVLSLRSDDAGLPSQDIKTEWYLVDRNRQLSQSIHTNLLPTVFRVPAGAYNLLARSGEGTLYGSDTFDLAPGEVVHSSISLVPAVRIRGVLLSHGKQPLSGVLVRALHPAWSREISSSWGQCTTGGDGSFEVFCGDLQAVEVEFSRAGDVLARRGIDCADDNVVILSNQN